jgi:hypothetical protein
MPNATTLHAAFDLATRTFDTALRLHRAAYWQTRLPGFVQPDGFGRMLQSLFVCIGEFYRCDLGDALEYLTAESSGVVSEVGLVAPGATLFAFEYARLLATAIRIAIGREHLTVSVDGVSPEDLCLCVSRMAAIVSRLDAVGTAR